MRRHFRRSLWPGYGQFRAVRTLATMASPLRTMHVLLAPDQIAYLRIRAAQEHTSVSSLVRYLVDKERKRDRATVRREHPPPDR